MQPKVGSTWVGCRARNAELAALDKLVSNLGYTNRSAALRALIRHSGDFFEVVPEISDAIEHIRKEINSIGINVNQVAKAVNSDVLIGRGGRQASQLAPYLKRLDKQLDDLERGLIKMTRRDHDTRSKVIDRIRRARR